MKEALFFIYLNSGYVFLRDLLLALLGRARAVVVYYHRVGGRDVLSKPQDEFRRDLQYLKRNYDCISLAELCRRIETRARFHRRVAVVTFDDGYRDNFLAALPVLKEEGVPATFFVATGFVGTDREFPHDHESRCAPLPKLTWDHLRMIEHEGFEVGSHTIDHTNLGAATEEAISREVGGSLETLNRELGMRRRPFSFPWGKPENITPAALAAVKRAGYYAAASAYGGRNGRGSDLFNIQRLDAGNGNLTRRAFEARVSGLDSDYFRFKLARLAKTALPALASVFRSTRRGTAALLLALIVLAAWVNAGNSAAGNTIYVAPSGNDQNPGTLARPLLTPTQAIERARPGDTVCLRGGRYLVKRFVWVGKPNITITSYVGERAAIMASTEEAEGTPTSVIVIAADNVALVGIDIQGGSYYGVKVDVDRTPATTGVQIRGCRIGNTGRDCIKTFNADNLLIEDCEIGPSGVRGSSNAEGIDSIGSVGVTIRRCYIHDTSTNGVYLKGGAQNGVIERCRIENTGRFGGILLGQDTDLEYMRGGAHHEAINCVARNNLVVNTGAAGVGTYSGHNIRFENNTLFDVARFGQAAFWVVTNSREVPSRDVTFKNNIVVVQSGRPMVFVLNLDGALDADSNIYYAARGSAEFRREMTSLEVANIWRFDEWRREMRVDARSLSSNPLLDPRAIYKPLPASPAIDRGTPLAHVHEDLLGNPRPRGAAFDIGAHESDGAGKKQ